MALLTFAGNGVTREVDTQKIRVVHMRSRIVVWARSMREATRERKVKVIGECLTYRSVDGWSPDDISRLTDKLRHELGDKLLGYAWVTELQERGAVHYHMTLVLDASVKIQYKPGEPGNYDLPFLDLAGWWPHGSTTMTWKTKLGKPLNLSSRYLMKYIQKDAQKGAFPKGLRMFAVVARCELTQRSQFYMKLTTAPCAVKKHIEERLRLWGEEVAALPLWKWDWLPTGGWYVTFRNMWWAVETQWRLVFIDGEAYSKGRKASSYAPD